MAKFEVILFREVTVSIEVTAADDDAAVEKAEAFAAEHLGVTVGLDGKPKKALEWSQSEDSEEWQLSSVSGY